MTNIEDMSETERQSWIILLADGAVLIWFLQKMTTSWSIKPNNIGMDAFGEVVISLIIITVVLHIVIASLFEVRKRKGDHQKDERDTEIERKGADWGYRIMQYGVGGVIVTMLIQQGVGADYQGPISIETPVEIIFFLLVISYVADLLKQLVMIHAYRS